ncbi:hypothetical protein [Streptomyces sp. NPDC051310]|uniref:hypothetical protein n=1 Tax=Streptomyces sp. NPDC051310 TaxID=3365649 RepID=UPI0037A12297
MSICGLCEGDAEDGQLCRGCTTATLTRLDSLPGLYVALAAFLHPGGRASAQYGRSQAVDAPLPVSEPVLNLRGPGGIVGVVEDWHAAVHADRSMTEPKRAGSAEQRLRTAVDALTAGMPWIAMSWPEAGTFAREIRNLVKDILSIIDPRDPGERGVRLGACPAVDESGNICGAVLRRYPGEKAVACRWCGCSFPPATWPALKQLIDHDERIETRDPEEETCLSESSPAA